MQEVSTKGHQQEEEEEEGWQNMEEREIFQAHCMPLLLHVKILLQVRDAVVLQQQQPVEGVQDQEAGEEE